MRQAPKKSSRTEQVSSQERALLPRAQLIHAKLRPPPLASALVDRHRLVARLDQATHKKLVLLVAHIGSGKTTLLRQWCDGPGASRPVAWLSLDEEDDTPRVFFSYLMEAVRNAVPSFDAYVTGPLRDAGHLRLDHLSAMLQAGWARAERDFVIVLDGLHWISDPAILRALRHLLEHSPAQVHWVISSRRMPSLPLSQLKLQEQLVTLGPKELGLDAAEIADLSLKLHGRALSPENAAHVHGCTEGWVAGAKLALLSLNEPVDVGQALGRFNGSHREVASYLAGAALDDQPEALRQFLIASSVVDRMNADLCDAMLGITDSERLLEELEESQLFIHALDPQRHWYRYHTLFRDFLLGRLMREGAQRVNGLHHRASQWFMDHQLHEDALVHAFAAGDRSWCVAVTARCARAWMEAGHMQEILHWAGRLSRAEVLGHPELCDALALALILSRRFVEAKALLREARARCPAQGDVATEEQRAESRFRIRLLERVLRADTAEACVFEEDELPTHGNTDAFFAGVMLTSQAARLLCSNEFDAARRLALRARDLGRQADNLYITSYADSLLCAADRAQGKLVSAGDACERLIDAVRGAPRSPAWVNAAVALACARYEQNRLEEAAELCVELLPLTSAVSTVENFLNVYILLARIKGLQGRFEEAFQLLDYAHSTLESGGHPRFLARICFEKIRLELEHGHTARAAAVAQEFGVFALATSGEWAAARRYEASWGYLGQAHALVTMHQGRHAEAQAVLAVLRDSARRAGNVYRQVPAELALALSLWRAGNDEAAFDTLNECLAPEQQFGSGRGAFDEVPGLPELLRAAIESHRLAHIRPNRYFRQLTSQTAKGGDAPTVAAPPRPPQPLEPLTEREIGILTLVSKGHCNKAISEASGITLTTTKWHLRNAFAKLEVNSRTAAIARARDLGLIC